MSWMCLLSANALNYHCVILLLLFLCSCTYQIFYLRVILWFTYFTLYIVCCFCCAFGFVGAFAILLVFITCKTNEPCTSLFFILHFVDFEAKTFLLSISLIGTLGDPHVPIYLPTVLPICTGRVAQWSRRPAW